MTARDEDRLREVLGEARRQIAFYASTRTYQDSIKMAGFEDEGALLHRLSMEQRWAEMAKIVDDDFVEQFAIVATWDELPAKMAERYAGVNTEVGFRADIQTPEDAEHAREVIAQLREIPAYGEVEPAAVSG
ncbi:MAG: LLM class flavin-dependent oxidoreductase [Chloroflexi bacterium]|nr:LLM class flavin-dependent oxidoreductase [Chloroflexota bacterium]